MKALQRHDGSISRTKSLNAVGLTNLIVLNLAGKKKRRRK